MSQFLGSMGTKLGDEIIKRGSKKENVWQHRAILEGKKGPPPPPLGDPHIVNNTLARGDTEFLFKC